MMIEMAVSECSHPTQLNENTLLQSCSNCRNISAVIFSIVITTKQDCDSMMIAVTFRSVLQLTTS